MAQPEARVLKPRDPSIRDQNKWPQFTLTNAEVRDPKTGEFTSILCADSKRPLSMTGKLVTPEKKYVHCLRHPSRPNPIIQVVDVTSHAFGEYHDGGWATWGRGESGWFEVKPSKAYAHVHEGSVEAVEILYFMKDQHEWGDMLSYKELFRRYAMSHTAKAPDWKAAAQKFYEHRTFLANEMKKGNEVVWPQTPIYQHFLDTFPELFKPSPRSSRAGSNRGERQASVKSSRSATHSRSTRLNSLETSAGEADNMSTTSSRRRAFTPAGPTAEELEARGQTLWKITRDTYKKFSADPDDLTLETFATELHTWYVFDDVAQASDYMCALAPQLVTHMNKSRIFKWEGTAVYKALLKPKLPAVSRKRALAIELEARPPADAERVRRLHAGEESESELLSSASSDSEARPTSALRPKSSTFADKGAKRRGKYLRASRSSAEADDEDMLDAPSPPKRKADGPGRPGRPRKRKMGDTASPMDVDSEHGSDADASELEIELPLRRKADAPAPDTVAGRPPYSRRDQPASHGRNTRSHPRPPSPLAVPSIRIQSALSEEPNGPSDTWICSEDGCRHKVYGATKELGRRLIREHIDEHEEADAAGSEDLPRAVNIHEGALDLLRAEEEMCNLPVSNLIRRIRDLAALQDAPAFPVPVTRRF